VEYFYKIMEAILAVPRCHSGLTGIFLKKNAGQVRCGSPRGVAPTSMTEYIYACDFTYGLISNCHPELVSGSLMICIQK
jgi:hypothetical protein